MREYEAYEEDKAEDPDEEEEEEEDPPTTGRQLLGWANGQATDAKGWLIGLGKKLKFPHKILDWTPRQVDIAYTSYKKAKKK